ncbi:MAG: hypothetical protein CL678_03435 [Bdellovibrionaceae bacterium]|nr:hypothetical protein [Pseudobdellovibrionaceae bacterium]|tara:strand:+ start:5792 stop:6565 length:774 start_codon:yes stop_codon:yes gene_type:complete
MNRTFIFLFLFVLFFVLETFRPYVHQKMSQFNRLTRHFGLILISRPLLWGVSLLGIPRSFDLGSWSFFPGWVRVIFVCLFLDLLIYFQHRLMHEVSLLWKLHQVHHQDIYFDVSTGIRFHPIEILLSYLFKIGVLFLFQIPFSDFLIYEILLSSFAIFTHANWSFPPLVEKWVSKILITSPMHRVHHFREPKFYHKNYGNFLSFWDRLFGTFQDYDWSDVKNHEIGLDDQRTDLTFIELLKSPFTKNVRTQEGRVDS